MSDSVRPHRRQPTRLPCPWDSPGKNTGVGCHFLLQCMKVKSESEVAQSCPTLRDPMDCSPPGSSVHGVFQARVLKWGAIAFSFSACSVPQLRQLGSRPWRCCFRGSAASPGRLCFLKPSFAVVCGAPLLANAEPLCLTFSKINSFLLSGVLLSGISSNC